MGYITDFDAWCSAIPGVERLEEKAWCQSSATQIFYPADGLQVLAKIEDNSFWFQHRNKVIAQVMRRLPPSGIFLDIGGGNGCVSQKLIQEGFVSVVVEPDPSGVATAKQRGLLTLQAAFQDLKIPSSSVGAAGMFDVLEHIEADGDTLSQLLDAVVPGGRVYIAVPAYNALWSNEDAHAGHFRRYTVSNLELTLRTAGFLPEFSTYFFRILVPAVFSLRTIPSWLGLREAGTIQSEQEHTLPDRQWKWILERSLTAEIDKLAIGESIPFGTSCLTVARKPF